jgi:AcrR family transcriptional regulator
MVVHRLTVGNIVTGMEAVKSRRDRYATITKAAVLEGARDLFVERGFDATSVDGIARAAEVSKGAVYHHFSDKKDIFAELLVGVLETTMASVISAAEQAGTDWERVAAAVRTFLESYVEDSKARAILKQAPSVLSQESIREVNERVALPFVRGWLQQLRDNGKLHPVSVEPTARILFGLLCEAIILVADSDDPIATSGDIESIILHLFGGLLKTD